MDCLPSQNEDFASYGILCADALAAALNYEGKVAAITMSAVNQVANTRDDAFVERIQTYENIELVEVAGIEVVSDTGTVASALLTRHPIWTASTARSLSRPPKPLRLCAA